MKFFKNLNKIRENSIFNGIRKIGFFTLRKKMIFAISVVVLGSVLTAFGTAKLFELWLPYVSINIPFSVQLIIFSLIVAVISAHFISKLFFDPIKDLREGMQKIADGDFNTRVETKTSSAEIKELVAGFNMMAQELESTEILQTDFVSNVSHEFKTPINAIEGYTTLLQSAEGITDVENEYIEKILFNTRRLSSLVSNILLLSKIDNLSIQTHKERFQLDEQIRESIVALESAWEPKNIEFDVDLDDVVFYGNESLMRHVWDNLIGNAIKFSPENGEIKIRLREDKGNIIFTVADRGPGISENSEKHIFDKFYQEDTSHKEEGNGLGLPLVKRILTIANGKIQA